MTLTANRYAMPAGLALLGLAAGAVAPLLMAQTTPVAPVAAVLAAVVCVLAVSRPLVVLYLAIALVPLELFSLRLGGVGLTVTELLLVLAGYGWAVGRIAAGRLPWVPSIATLMLAGLVLSGLPGLAVAQDVFPVVKVTVMWTAFFFVAQLIIADGSRETVRRLLLLLAVAAGIVGLIALVQTGAGSKQELLGAGENASGRAVGSFNHSNTLATFLVLCLPGALVLGLRGRAGERALGAMAFAAISAGLVFSLSRGGFLAGGAALALLLVWRPVRLAAIATVMAVAAIAVAGLLPSAAEQQASVVTARLETLKHADSGGDQRTRLWRITPQIFEDHPVAGVGAENYIVVAPRYGLNTKYGNPIPHAHNQMLTWAAERGIIGLAALLGISLAVVGLLAGAWRATTGVEHGLVVGLSAAFLAMLVRALADYDISNNAVGSTLFVLAACAQVMFLRSRRPAQEAGAP